ncbi:MAG: 4-hydroxythreonine-4-phosphate dehydrogenase PdxA [Pseudomonadota bacterium]|jgi:4-hydroxythreonine-4-phosphate dehydrogenase
MLKSIINNSQLPLICVTSGEPAGIGPEICLDLLTSSYNRDYRLLLIGDSKLFIERAQLVGKKIAINLINDLNQEFSPEHLNVWQIDCPQRDCLAKPQLINANYVLAILDCAINFCQQQLTQLIVTAPINKDIINQAGIKFSGHTEYFAEKFAINKVVMMLSNPQLKVALLTTHLPLKEVVNHVTSINLEQTLQIIHHSFAKYFNISKPRIAVCGLNPHAGENGYLGREELEIINPLIQTWQQRGYLVSGCYPADTIFNQAHNFDIILAMYHDQGLPIVKFSDFEQGVNTTLGLPIIRTSVDHGTALNLAGKGLASSASLLAALKLGTSCYAQQT